METMDDGIKKNSSKKKELTIIAIISVIVIAVLLGGGYYFFSKPKAIFQESINYLTKGLKASTENTKLLELFNKNDRIKYEGNMHLSLNQSFGLGFSDLDFNFIVNEDKKEKEAQYSLNTQVDKKSLLELDTYLKDNKMYGTIKNIMDKYYYTKQDYVTFFGASDNKEMEELMKVVEKSVKRVIHDGRFKKSNVTKEIDGKEENLKKLSLEITDTLLSELVQEFVKQVNDNDKALDALASLTKEDRVTTSAMLISISENMKNTTGETIIIYNAYYRGMNEIRMLELVDDEGSITYTANENYHLEFKLQNQLVFDLKITKEEDLYKINLEVEDEKITGEYKEEDQNFSLDLQLTDKTEGLLGSIQVLGKQISDTESNIEITIKNEDIKFITLTLHSKYTFNEKISTEELKNAKDIEEMTEEELQNILNNIENHEILGPIIEMFNEFFNEENDYPMNDYDFDYGDDF